MSKGLSLIIKAGKFYLWVKDARSIEESFAVKGGKLCEGRTLAYDRGKFCV
jgi:hypothetical protein